MTDSPPITLRARFRRLVVALILSIALPVGGLLIVVLIAEKRTDRLTRELTLYHLPTESLAGELEIELARLIRAVREPEDEQLTPFWARKADAHHGVRTKIEEILLIQETYGSARYAPTIDRIRRTWDRFEIELESVGTVLDKENWVSLSIALKQLESLHRIDSAGEIDSLRAGGTLPSTLFAFIGLFVVSVSSVLTWRIVRLMEMMATRVDERTAELTESETRFRQLADNVDSVFWMVDVDANELLYVSPAYETIWGRPVASISKQPLGYREGIIPDDREKVEKGCSASKESCVCEYRIERPDGSVRWIRDRGFPICNDAGETVRVAGIAVDVTEQREAEVNVRLSEEHLRSLMESAQGFVVFRNYARDSEGKLGANVFVSPSIRDIMGVSDPSKFESWFENIHEEDLPRMVAALRKSREDFTPLNEEMRIFHRDRGEWRWIRAISHPVHDSKTGEDFFNGIIIDISDEKRGQSELEKAFGEIQKLKELAEAENVYLREEMRLGHLHEEIVGGSEALKSVIVEAERVSGTDSTALLLGETGTGKELVARAIHRMSGRSDQPMIAVNCAAIPATLVESELFGREKGAYTGAMTSQMGRFEAADGGTLFLDEVGELPEAMQAKLLRVLEEGCFERLGSTKTMRVDVRVIAATNRELEERVRAGEFREDLFYRLNVFPITIPPLRERREDIPVLARHFVKEFAGKMGKDVDAIPRLTLEALGKYSWPGNVRELRNVIERGMIVTRGKKLKAVVPAETARKPRESKQLAEVEKDHIVAVLKSVGWKLRGPGGAAELLGLPASTLESRMKKLGIERPGKVKPTDPNLR